MTDYSKLASAIKKAPGKSRKAKSSDNQVAESPSTQAQAARTVGRPRTGKRSDPEYRQVSAWIRKETYREVQDRLFPDRREFSDLVQALLEKWLKKPVE